jgi:hypothetical protein
MRTEDELDGLVGVIAVAFQIGALDLDFAREQTLGCQRPVIRPVLFVADQHDAAFMTARAQRLHELRPGMAGSNGDYCLGHE